MTFVILNGAGYRWGSETYQSEDEARRELHAFFKGLSGVRFELFAIAPIEAAPDPYEQYVISGAPTGANRQKPVAEAAE